MLNTKEMCSGGLHLYSEVAGVIFSATKPGSDFQEKETEVTKVGKEEAMFYGGPEFSGVFLSPHEMNC